MYIRSTFSFTNSLPLLYYEHYHTTVLHRLGYWPSSAEKANQILKLFPLEKSKRGVLQIKMPLLGISILLRRQLLLIRLASPDREHG